MIEEEKSCPKDNPYGYSVRNRDAQISLVSVSHRQKQSKNEATADPQVGSYLVRFWFVFGSWLVRGWFVVGSHTRTENQATTEQNSMQQQTL